MLTLEAAVLICIDRIVNKTKHANYDRTVKLAILYEQLVTGEHHDSLIQEFFATCSAEEITKIKAVTFPITSSICNSLDFAFKKVLRTQPVLKQIDFKGQDADKKKEVVQNALDKFYSGNDFDYYIKTRFHDLSFRDPNSFIVTEFQAFDHKKEKAKPYPFEVYSHNAVNYEKVNGVLQFLLVEQAIKFKTKEGAMADGIKLTIYLENDLIVFNEVAKNITLKQDETSARVKDENAPDRLTKYVTGERQFDVTYAQHKQGAVPAMAVGYVPDKKTNGVTFVSPIHYGALPYLMKTVKTVCEMDMTMHVHTFPQKFQYVQKCKIGPDAICANSGERVDKCSKCGGTGIPVHKSTKDIVELEMPKSVDEFIDLSKISHYQFPPIEGIKFQDEYIEKLKLQCYKSVFNSETFSKDEVQQTATGKNIDLQNVYDTLSDYAWKVSDFWMRTVTFVSIILDYPKDTCNHKLVYPSDFKLKSVTDLLNDLSLANESNAPSFVKTEITRDIASILYQDRPNEMLRFDSKMKLFPFTGKNVNEIIVLMGSEDVLRIDKVLYTYFEPICGELDSMSLIDNDGIKEMLKGEAKMLARYEEARKKGLMWLFDLPDDIQKFLVYAKAQEKLDEIGEESKSASSFTDPGEGGNP